MDTHQGHYNNYVDTRTITHVQTQGHKHSYHTNTHRHTYHYVGRSVVDGHVDEVAQY